MVSTSGVTLRFRLLQEWTQLNQGEERSQLSVGLNDICVRVTSGESHSQEQDRR